MTQKNTTPGIQLLGARVLIQPLEQQSRTASGIILPETSKEKPQTGLVVAIGDDEDIRVRVDEKVLFAKYTGADVKFDGIDYLLLDHSDMLARVN